MKKALSLLLALVMSLYLCACGSKEPRGVSFENQDDLLAALSGMWLVEDYEKDEFYVFREGNLYYTNLWAYERDMEQLLQDTLSEDGLDSWRAMDFEKANGELECAQLLGEPLRNVTYEPKKGTVIIDKDREIEKKIIVTEYGAVLMTSHSVYGTDMTKVADDVSLSGEKFEDIFNRLKTEGTVPKNLFLPTAQAYGELLQNAHGQVWEWPVVSDKDGTIIKSLDGTLEANYGSIILSESSVTLSLGTKDSNGSPYTLMYSTSGTGTDLLIRDRMFFDLKSTLAFVSAAVQNIPNALTADQLNALFNQEATLEGGVYQLEKTVGSITYKIHQCTSWPDMYILVMVIVDDTIPLADCLAAPDSGIQNTPEDTQPATEPQEPTQVTEDQTEGTLEQLLVPTKVWRMTWMDDYSVTWIVDYHFDEAGNFRWLLADSMEYFLKGQGTYSVDGNTLSIFDELENGTEQYVYDWSPENGTWEQKSVTGYAHDHEQGDVFSVCENTDLTAERFDELYQIVGEDDWD